MQVPAVFDYERASTVEDALALLRRHGADARLIAGGHSLLPMMKLRLARPEVLVDINGLKELDYIRLEGDELAIGAMTRHATVLSSTLLAQHYHIFAEAERVIADPLVRNRGTVGGSLCQSDPSEDLSAVFAALHARMVIRSATETRSVDAKGFHVGPYQSAVRDGEILTEVRVPLRPGSGSSYRKVERRAGDWSIAAVGAVVQLQSGTVVDAGIGITAVGAEQFTCTEAEELLRGSDASESVVEAAAKRCGELCNPSPDQRGPVDYKRHLVEVLAGRALRTAIARAKGDVN